MKNTTIISSSFNASHDQNIVTNFLQERGINLQANKDVVKSFFDGNDYQLAIYDGRNQEHTMLLTVKNFARNEDLLLELNAIFLAKTKDTSAYHILKFARQATDEIIGLLPTFQVFFGEQPVSVPTPNNNIQNVFVQQSNSIAA
jgi:hypothetical protein